MPLHLRLDLVQMVFFIMILPLVNPVSLIEVILYFTISDCVLKRVFSFPCEVTGAHYIYKVILRSPVHADIWDYSQRPWIYSCWAANKKSKEKNTAYPSVFWSFWLSPCSPAWLDSRAINLLLKTQRTTRPPPLTQCPCGHLNGQSS